MVGRPVHELAEQLSAEELAEYGEWMKLKAERQEEALEAAKRKR